MAAVNRDAGTAFVYNIDDNTSSEIQFGNRQMLVATNDRYGNPGDRIFALNHDGSLLAVSFSNGAIEIFNTSDGQEHIEIFDQSDYAHFDGGFFGKYFAFSATNAEGSLFSVIDTEDIVETVSASLPEQLGVFTNTNGIYMSYKGTNVSIDPITAKQTPIDYDPRDKIAGGFRIEGTLNSPIVRILKYVSQEDTVIFKYNNDYVHDEARLNADGTRVMLFSFDEFRIYNTNGSLVDIIAIPSASQVFDQQYRRDGDESYLEVTYYDGTVRNYSGDDGTLVSEKKISSPDPVLFDEFTTDSLYIASPLHGTPSAYNLATGELIRELEKDAYLAYVTQIGEYVITEYISADGDRYGLLLDVETCETLAYIPNLCDIIGERLIIDDRTSGTLRETRLYSPKELVEIARS